jgi:hypothetical protein
MNGKPDRISLEELGNAVERAVKLATERNRLEAEQSITKSDFQRFPGWLVGRQIRGEVGFDAAFEFAKQVTADVESSMKARLVPTVTVFDDVILCGFIERFGDKIELPTLQTGPGF